MNRRYLLQSLAALPLASMGQRLLAQTADQMPAPSLGDPAQGCTEGWTIAVIPDTQNYAKFAKNQKNFERMTDWLIAHLDAWKIKLVMHEGDLVEQNNIAIGGGQGWGDQNSTEQWKSAQQALRKLYGKVPTIFATGNHDYGIRNAESRESQFPEYFPITANPLVSDGQGGGILIDCAANAFGVKTLENAAYEIAVPGGKKLLVISLEWGPRKAVVDWAMQLCQQEKYRQHFGIFLTHDFMLPGDERDGQDGNRKRSGNPHTYGTGKPGDTHDGEDLWQQFVSRAPQIKIVLNGHEMGSHVGRRSDKNQSGQLVHQMLFNAQGFGGGSDEKGNGGDCWLRLLTFSADHTSLAVRTFSPLKLDAGLSPWWDHPQWNFTLPMK
jgi:hypothetical protein